MRRNDLQQFTPDMDYRRDVQIELSTEEGDYVGYFDTFAIGGDWREDEKANRRAFFVVLTSKPEGNGNVVCAVPLSLVCGFLARLELRPLRNGRAGLRRKRKFPPPENGD